MDFMIQGHDEINDYSGKIQVFIKQHCLSEIAEYTTMIKKEFQKNIYIQYIAITETTAL